MKDLEKGFFRGTQRACSPEETITAFDSVGKAAGITRIANVTGLDCLGIPVFIAIRPNARSLSVSQGKGLDRATAYVSAMMESIELWHAEHICCPLRHDSVRALEREGAVMDISRSMIRPRISVRRDVAYEWIAGEDLSNGAETWVPYEIVSMNTVLPPERVRTFASNSNGLASGNHMLEALVHATAEVIERDAITLFHAMPEERRAKRRIDPKSVTDDACLSLMERIERARLELSLWDMTTDVGVPSFLAAIVEYEGRHHWRTLGVHVGYGSHLSPAIALSRAITEAAQSRLTLITGGRDDNPRRTYEISMSPERVSKLRRYFFNAAPTMSFNATSLTTPTFNGDLKVMLRGLRAVGITQVIAVPLSKPSMRLPVVKVVAPGLEQYVFSHGFQAGPRAKKASS